MFEWDERKRAGSLAKHGVDFVRASRILEGWVYAVEDQRRDYGERRWRAFGIVEGDVLMVAYTQRGDNRRIITARKARVDEREACYASVPGPDPEDERPH